MADRPLAAVLTVGTEITTGLRLDTNTAQIAAACAAAGYRVTETVSVPDDRDRIAGAIARLARENSLLVVTGGLGPTHDDVTREAAAQALGRPLRRDPALVERLQAVADRHGDERAREQVLRQADVVEGARVIEPESGTAPGQVVEAGSSLVVLLPGPPSEMRPMLEQVLGSRRTAPEPIVLRCARIAESDAQLRVQGVLAAFPKIELTLLASPALVDVVLMDAGAGRDALVEAAQAAALALGEACYSMDGASLPEAVVRLARATLCTLATAESCTGGMVASAITDVPGASDVFVGGAVAYSNALKRSLLGVPEEVLAEHGAVSPETAQAMASGALRLGARVAVATTGIAGPGGGTPDKPVGLVWTAVATPERVEAHRLQLHGDRQGVRQRATVHALDFVRLTLERM
ncbi:MAG: nicotinamide-nucleotide amidohydrolase family protein [Coriobacteriia bacterium]|nr:nicotinamide-nucleotide amidohydrolase family protein [Coriobacteriia bacterium]